MHPGLQALLPQRALSALVGRLGRVERPRWLVRAALRAFVRRYRVDLAEAERPLDAYASFTDFFTRALRPGRRPLPADPRRLVCPADGALAAAGTVRHGRMLQAKGQEYTAAALLGDDELAAAFEGGATFTVYLSPRDYHRVHAPWSGTLIRRLHHGGRLLSVSRATAARVPRLFAENERVVLVFADPVLGTWALVLVGALIVGGVETVWEGTVNPRPRGLGADRAFEGLAPIVRGDEVGRFRAGSTAIVLLPPGVVLDPLPDNAPVRMGQALGSVPGAPAAQPPAPGAVPSIR